jgi:copper chaperone CopZ
VLSFLAEIVTMSALRLRVTGMHCGNCKTKVERALKAVPGTFAVEVDVSGAAEVEFDGKTPPEKFVEAVKAIGYDAEVAA